ncbi:hypothetical protein DERP_010192 [Dermatophagoides pteronyssinus]|uniref:RING-type domain-containing protein n=1 Tax=Dermatophagoides pteronyssinus TaxID=6956 RepID=A0ABQ8J713_DERPT|nr:hypothetical protein DERP_010192 [Dermatophagoides pteronyssinus]
MSNQNQRNNKGSSSSLLFVLGAAIGAAGAFLIPKLFSENNEESSHRYSNRGNCSTSSSSTGSIPIKPAEMCVICQDKMEPPMEQLPCGHIFHQNCIIQSLKSNNFCPICRIFLSQSQMKVYLDRINE